MSLAAMKSPSRQCSAPVTTMYYKCDDCGDLSHSQESLNLHRSVCHTIKSHDTSNSEQQNSDVLTRADQIAESCECPKCGENLLLLREHSFNCSLCEFQDTDQERFFVHLKKHYEPSAVSNVDPGSLIIEQVIDDTNFGECNDDDLSGGEIDGRDDPEYVPSDSEDDESEGGDVLEVSNAKSPKLGISWKSLVDKGGVKKKLDFVKPSDEKLNSPKKTENLNMGISWHRPQEKGAPKKLSFVKTPATLGKPATVDSPISGRTAEENGFQKNQTKLSYEKKLSPPSKAVTIKKEPGEGTGTKWVRIEDIKYLGGSMAGTQRNTSSVYKRSSSSYYGMSSTKLPSPLNGSSFLKGPYQSSTGTSSAKRARTSEELQTPISGTEPTKKPPKKSKTKEPKSPKERKIPVCGVCKKVFANSQCLKHHLKIHTGEKDYTCEQCGKAFTQWSTCQQHIVSIHSGIKKYTCEYCGSCFARSSALAQHRRIHTGEILHQCNICGKGYRAKSYLDRHRTLHTGEKRFKCEFCSKTFRTSTDMKRHRNSVHFGLGNVSLTLAKELLLTKMDGLRASQRPSSTVIQRFVDDDSSSDDSEEVVRATAVIADSHYEL